MTDTSTAETTHERDPSRITFLFDHPSEIEGIWRAAAPDARTAQVDVTGGAFDLLVDLRGAAPTPPRQLHVVPNLDTGRDDESVEVPPHPRRAQEPELEADSAPTAELAPPAADAAGDEVVDGTGGPGGGDAPAGVEPGSAPPAPSNPTAEEEAEHDRDPTAPAATGPAAPSPARFTYTRLAPLTDQIVDLLEMSPDKVWSTAQVLEHLPVSKHHSARQTLSNLVRQDRIRRIAPGRYQALEHLASREPADDPDHEGEDEEVDDTYGVDLDDLQRSVLDFLESDIGRRYTTSELSEHLDAPVDDVRRACYLLAGEHLLDQVDPSTFRHLNPTDRVARRRAAAVDGAFRHG